MRNSVDDSNNYPVTDHHHRIAMPRERVTFLRMASILCAFVNPHVARGMKRMLVFRFINVMKNESRENEIFNGIKWNMKCAKNMAMEIFSEYLLIRLLVSENESYDRFEMI